MTKNVTRRLAEFLADSQWHDIPDEVRQEAKRTILNFVGTALGGCRDEAVELALRGLKPFFGPPQATVIGRSERPDALSAAFLNAISANVLEFDVVSRTAARNAFLPRIAASCQATRGQSTGPVCPIIDQSGGTLVGFTSFYGSLCREDATVGAILLWLLGIPIPIIILLLLLWH